MISTLARALWRTTARLLLVWLAASCVARLPALADDAAAAAATTVAVPTLATPPALGGTIDDSWGSAARVTLGYDFTNRRHPDEATTVAIAQDATSIDVAFDVVQHEAIVESTETNGSSVESDDYVGVYLSPNGPNGFQYTFVANPHGARYQTSSENSAYTPPWSATAKPTKDGYAVTMRIPFDIIRSGGPTTWRAQFVRETVHANSLDVWTFDDHAQSSNDATYFGTLIGLGAKTTSSRPKPRAQIYALGEKTTKALGGDTSRLGADLSVPITPTASFLASLHPDFSNVETDRQTIAPTAFAHQFSEVRPFFTQAGQSFDQNFSNVNGPLLLYTPAIPTFRDGYAVEGTQGAVTFDAFDAVGTHRTDEAETATFSVSDTSHAFSTSLQNIAVDSRDGFHDAVTSITTGYMNSHTHFMAYANYADETGAGVTDPGQGTFLQTGFGYASATTTSILAYNHLGAQFSPADAYVAQNDITGPEFFIQQTVPFKANTILHDISASTFLTGQRERAGLLAQNQASSQVDFGFSNLITIHAFYNQQAVRTYSNEFLPFDGNGFYVGYKVATATPISVQYAGGPYDHGTLDSWTYLSTLKVAPKVYLTLEEDEDQYLTTHIGETRTNQWLERASLDFQFNRETQFDLGARRLIGSFLAGYAQPPNFTPVSGGNLSAAFHFLSKSGQSECYAVYGDANSFSTTPALFLKCIRYIGAAKARSA